MSVRYLTMYEFTMALKTDDFQDHRKFLTKIQKRYRRWYRNQKTQQCCDDDGSKVPELIWRCFKCNQNRPASEAQCGACNMRVSGFKYYK